jgi:hypothetical protein
MRNNNAYNHSASDKRYYLINKEILKKIKNDYHYKDFEDYKKKELSQINGIEPMNTLVEIIPKNEINAKYENMQIEPNIIPVYNPLNQNETFWIYDNFEIIKEETIKIFIDKHKIETQNIFEFNFGEGKAIIHYGNTIGNKKYISVIGRLDNDNTFINEYLCIYNKHSSNEKHMNRIRGNLLNYLNNLKLYMNTSPITDGKYKEVGLIIKYESNQTNINQQNKYVNKNEYKILYSSMNDMNNRNTLYNINKINYLGNNNFYNVQNATTINSLGSQNFNIDAKKTKEYLELQNLLIEEKKKNELLNGQILL